MTELVPVICEVTLDGKPAINVTDPPFKLKGDASCNAFTSAFVDDNEQVEIPEALVAEHAPYVLPLPVLVAVNVGMTPTIAILVEFLSVMVTIEVLAPFATIFVVPVMLELIADAAPALNTTVPPVTLTGVTIANVFISAAIDFKVQLA
jgi:hypothetical protein